MFLLLNRNLGPEILVSQHIVCYQLSDILVYKTPTFQSDALRCSSVQPSRIKLTFTIIQKRSHRVARLFSPISPKCLTHPKNDRRPQPLPGISGEPPASTPSIVFISSSFPLNIFAKHDGVCAAINPPLPRPLLLNVHDKICAGIRLATCVAGVGELAALQMFLSQRRIVNKRSHQVEM